MKNWHDHLNHALVETACMGTTITYRALADRCGVPPPRRIHALTDVLEEMIRADHAAGRALRAAVAISRSRDGLPGPGFFQVCREIGRYFGPDLGPQAALFHRLECIRAQNTANQNTLPEAFGTKYSD